jgi:hypothetical protein
VRVAGKDSREECQKELHGVCVGNYASKKNIGVSNEDPKLRLF